MSLVAGGAVTEVRASDAVAVDAGAVGVVVVVEGDPAGSAVVTEVTETGNVVWKDDAVPIVGTTGAVDEASTMGAVTAVVVARRSADCVIDVVEIPDPDAAVVVAMTGDALGVLVAGDVEDGDGDSDDGDDDGEPSLTTVAGHVGIVAADVADKAAEVPSLVVEVSVTSLVAAMPSFWRSSFS